MIVNRFDYDKKRNTRSSRAGSRLFPLEKGAKELFARHFGSGKIETREKLFGEPSQTQRLTAFQTHGKVRFCPPGKNPLTSHAVRCYKCCLGLPLAFCAAFRCSLRWRFTTRLFVHVFLPFGFFDKLQKHRPVHSHWAVFFLL